MTNAALQEDLKDAIWQDCLNGVLDQDVEQKCLERLRASDLETFLGVLELGCESPSELDGVQISMIIHLCNTSLGYDGTWQPRALIEAMRRGAKKKWYSDVLLELAQEDYRNRMDYQD